jgi:hypothetical protein
LNERNIPTARGDGEWSAVQVARVLARQPMLKKWIDKIGF